MTRSRQKGPFIDRDILLTTNTQKVKNTQSRRSVIHPNLVGTRIAVHTGLSYRLIKIKEQMIGHKLGEFAPTRILYKFKRKKQPMKKNKRSK